MALPRQNRHRDNPPDRSRSLTKRQRGGVSVQGRLFQRPKPARTSGAVSTSRKEGSSLMRLMGRLLPSWQTQRPPVVRTPLPPTKKPIPPFQREQKSLLDRLLASASPAHLARSTSRSAEEPARENGSSVRQGQPSFLARVFKTQDQPGVAQRVEVPPSLPIARHLAQRPPVAPPVSREGGAAVSRDPSPLIQKLFHRPTQGRPSQRPARERVAVVPGASRDTPSLLASLFGFFLRVKIKQRVASIRSSSMAPQVVPYVDKTNPQARITFLLGCYIVVFCVLAMRAVDLTIFQGDSLQQRARSQHKKKIIMTANRGRILDRNGRTLAISLPTYALSVDIDQAENRAQLAADLAPILGVPLDEFRSRMLAFKPGSYPILKRQLPPEVTRKIRNLDHHSLFFMPESRRFYTMGEVTSHILGFVNFEGRGREGLERSFEDELHGINGAQVIGHDRLGRPMPMVKTVTEPHPGADLSTTIDTTIQYVAYRALLKGVQKSQAKAGMAVVLDANNGEILALVNQPSYNPNNLADSKSNDRRNRVVTDLFEPGSTFKVFTIGAALEEKTVTPDTVIDIENGTARIADRTITDFHKGVRYHTVSQVLQRSSNVGAAKIGLQLGNELLEKYIYLFGFGAPTGIGLPSDPGGSIPNISHYRKIGLATRSYGYGITTTPLHITMAFAAAINGGIYYPPTLVKGRVVDGVMVPTHRPPPHRVISEETSAKLRKILHSVVSDEGTAVEAAVEGYQVGGKTGTARKAIPGQGYVRGRYYASFVGFIPVDKPRVVIFVSIDEPGGIYYGGKVAAPVFKEIAQEILPRLAVFPETHVDPPLPDLIDPLAPLSESVENTSLSRALEILSKQGIVPQVQGYGVVKSLETPTEGPPRLIMQ
ncbi:MAG: penicillin-binding transpeptidase domain-containing protein [Magnetococcus sp. THC-1_WYH]